jgi:hypothetical protein
VEVRGQDSLGQVNIARYDANTTVNAALGPNAENARSAGRRSNGTREQQAEFVRAALDIDDFDLELFCG